MFQKNVFCKKPTKKNTYICNITLFKNIKDRGLK